MHLVVGLGNPGKQYEKNRHNVGFMVVDELIRRLNPSPIQKSSFQGLLFKSGDTLLLKPQTYMNLSGKSVQAVKNFYKIQNEHIIVIHDDLDLGLGALRFKRGGSSGGHNGLKSIDEHIGSDYLRVRFGIGRPKHKSEVISYVLSDFTPKELACIRPRIEIASEAAIALCKEDLESVRSRYSRKPLICS